MNLNLFSGVFSVLIGSALVLSGCDGVAPKLAPVSKAIVEKADDTVQIDLASRVDILMVVDGSVSMDKHQRNLHSNIQSFIDELSQAAYLDYRVAVTIAGCKRDPRLQQYRAGCSSSGIFHTADITDSPPYYVSKGDPNGLDKLRARLKVGTGHDVSETFFGPVLDALKSPVSNFPQNRGFLRREAHFIPIFITDTEDQTKSLAGDLDPAVFYSELIAIKNRADLIIPYSAHIPADTGGRLPRGCERDTGGVNSGVPLRIEAFLDMAQGAYVSLCDSDFGARLAEVAKDLVERIEPVIYLDEKPYVPSIQLMYGSTVIPNEFDTGWVYDPQLNVIRLGRDLDLGDQSVTFQLTYIKANQF